METAIVVFTRDLRLHDNPALHQACTRARQVVPLFVADPAIAAPPNRACFLAESLADLRQQLRERQADLVIRTGDPAAQATAAFPGLARENYRPGPAWHDDDDALAAWRAGQTGIPVVDAGLRQLAAEGFMHNRARMITTSFLTRNLGLDWRHGYRHFAALLADGDVASNAGNWQWVAGTGHNTRPNRVMNPVRQAQRFDPAGEYVRRYVPELAGLPPARVHTPWRLDAATRRALGYPDPLVDLG